MISNHFISRYPFFAGLSRDQIAYLSKTADIVAVESRYSFFHEGEKLDRFFFVLEGKVDLIMGAPDQESDLTVCTVGTGEIFGWSALLSPYEATAGAAAKSDCKVIAFDCKKLRAAFIEDHQFAYLMTMKAAQTIRERLHCIRIESLAFATA